ncbi:hypothetical protein BD311DRAFT_352372 [Dichomitus squalens]|uniref:Uncharacterized protein n=1 Tax=Dichomitus squalens TaxID=114155 RepID=A0A4Q9N5I5_9APHY|nr:hypothetical protein BD311DRAFT_352372 [Dichomitus squalens]
MKETWEVLIGRTRSCAQLVRRTTEDNLTLSNHPLPVPASRVGVSRAQGCLAIEHRQLPMTRLHRFSYTT